MSESNDNLIAEARGIDADWVRDNSSDDSVEVIRVLADALEEATKADAHPETPECVCYGADGVTDQKCPACLLDERNALAAVLEKVIEYADSDSHMLGMSDGYAEAMRDIARIVRGGTSERETN